MGKHSADIIIIGGGAAGLMAAAGAAGTGRIAGECHHGIRPGPHDGEHRCRHLRQ